MAVGHTWRVRHERANVRQPDGPSESERDREYSGERLAGHRMIDIDRDAINSGIAELAPQGTNSDLGPMCSERQKAKLCQSWILLQVRSP
jgi:hypothetical protein